MPQHSLSLTHPTPRRHHHRRRHHHTHQHTPTHTAPSSRLRCAPSPPNDVRPGCPLSPGGAVLTLGWRSLPFDAQSLSRALRRSLDRLGVAYSVAGAEAPQSFCVRQRGRKRAHGTPLPPGQAATPLSPDELCVAVDLLREEARLPRAWPDTPPCHTPTGRTPSTWHAAPARPRPSLAASKQRPFTPPLCAGRRPGTAQLEAAPSAGACSPPGHISAISRPYLGHISAQPPSPSAVAARPRRRRARAWKAQMNS